MHEFYNMGSPAVLVVIVRMTIRSGDRAEKHRERMERIRHTQSSSSVEIDH